MPADSRPCDPPLMPDEPASVVLFYPHISSQAAQAVADTLASRWIGEGPKVRQLEEEFVKKLGIRYSPVAVGAGTDALHLAYLLTDLQPGDEVIVPVFTCTATNIPLLYGGIRPRFADIQRDTMNIDVDHVRRLVNKRTKAIVCVHYGGLPCDMDELLEIGRHHNIPIIEDAAHAVGATYRGEVIGNLSPFTMYSFQAIKHLTTGDGGMLVMKDPELVAKARRLRWFGIDRQAKQGGYWENDIVEVGYKYQMTDIAAAIGLANLAEIDDVLGHRRRLFELYSEGLRGIEGLTVLGDGHDDREHACWLCTIAVERRADFSQKLRDARIESGQVHFRNDRYSIFKPYIEPGSYPGMDYLESRYLVLPLHTRMTEEDVRRICHIAQSGW